MSEPDTLISYLRNAETEEAMVGSICGNLAFYQNIDTEERADAFSGSLYNWFIRECIERNQYLFFPDAAYRKILALYRTLVIRLKNLELAHCAERAKQGPIESDELKNSVRSLVREHRKSLIAVVQTVRDIDRKNDMLLPCAEYSREFQLSILGIDPETMAEPFLDIGCGEKASLVAEARKFGKQAVGIDQYQPAENEDCVIRANWLEFDYLPDYWGTIASHMAFSNHFTRAQKNDPELAAWYQAVYMEILESLRPGGVFYYTPALPRAEAFIDRSRFAVERKTNVPGISELDTVCVRKR